MSFMVSQQRSAAELKFLLKHLHAAMEKKQVALNELTDEINKKKRELEELAEASKELRGQIQSAEKQDKLIEAELAKQSAAAVQVQQQRLSEERKQISAQK